MVKEIKESVYDNAALFFFFFFPETELKKKKKYEVSTHLKKIIPL